MRYYVGNGLLNSAINNLPVELHLPSYNYCGPGTKIAERLARNDLGVNGLDEACKEHDILYSKEKNISRRHSADQVLANKALNRFYAKDSNWKEKLAALGVAGAMKAKVALGMGLKKSPQIFSKHTVTNCLKKLQRLSKGLEGSQKLVQGSVQILQNEQQSHPVKKDRKNTTKKIRKVSEAKKREPEESASNEDDEVENLNVKVKRNKRSDDGIEKRIKKTRKKTMDANKAKKMKKDTTKPIIVTEKKRGKKSKNESDKKEKKKPKFNDIIPVPWKRKQPAPNDITNSHHINNKKKRKLDMDDPVSVPDKIRGGGKKRKNESDEEGKNKKKQKISDDIPLPEKRQNRKRKQPASDDMSDNINNRKKVNS